MLHFTREIFSSQLSPDGRWVSVVLVNPDYGTGDVEIWDARHPPPRPEAAVHRRPGLDAVQPR